MFGLSSAKVLPQPYAPTDFTSSFTSPNLPSAQMDMVCNFCKRDVGGHLLASSAQVVIASPVASSQQLENMLNGTFTSPNSPIGAAKSALKPRAKNLPQLLPSLPKATRYPSYGLGVDVDFKFNVRPVQEDTSAKALLSDVCILMNPGAPFRNGMPATVPSITPTPSWMLKVPLEVPPMTGSFCCCHWRVVASSTPSKVANVMSETAWCNNVATTVLNSMVKK